MCVFQDGATGSRTGEAEEGDSGPPLREQTPSSRGDSGNDGPSTNAVGILTDHSRVVNHITQKHCVLCQAWLCCGFVPAAQGSVGRYLNDLLLYLLVD